MSAEPRVWLPGDEEPDDATDVVDAYQSHWRRTPTGWYPSDGGYHRQEQTWWWLTMHRGPIKEAT
ncbi:hypothetical protein ABT369_39475 [Dactylosporangium sp. NPDC000244]|uniref:hypothetical protein n=1 Tax=Dactylosporangium sp. NPDC000244 TaxID=3154365 RepID=UPI00332D5E4C